MEPASQNWVACIKWRWTSSAVFVSNFHEVKAILAQMLSQSRLCPTCAQERQNGECCPRFPFCDIIWRKIWPDIAWSSQNLRQVLHELLISNLMRVDQFLKSRSHLKRMYQPRLGSPCKRCTIENHPGPPKKLPTILNAPSFVRQPLCCYLSAPPMTNTLTDTRLKIPSLGLSAYTPHTLAYLTRNGPKCCKNGPKAWLRTRLAGNRRPWEIPLGISSINCLILVRGLPYMTSFLFEHHVAQRHGTTKVGPNPPQCDNEMCTPRSVRWVSSPLSQTKSKTKKSGNELCMMARTYIQCIWFVVMTRS